MKAGAPKGNKNAQKWTEEKAIDLMEKAVELSNSKEEDGAYTYDFIGEIARELKTTHHVLSYLSREFVSVEELHNQLKCNLEANCFNNAKKGKIKEGTAIVNLKSNYKWTDRIDQTGSQEMTITWNEEKSYNE